ncbi:MAG: hypothetical protein HY852_16410 [Bradyrhizobium sp.]|uniref:hypothetical protein n=1 Tax=Bradyrhizobium sp. TaxID=376 RepID=UPI0025C3EEC1|nr:hypothetical protein [Bradyrhizobium sp.]MBI5263393.1 hypothetical protein [Bradyrhizobium sp.]
MPNWFAYTALVCWPIISMFLFARLTLAKATVWTILGAQYFLPAATVIKIPMVPQFDKASIPSLCVLVGCMVRGQKIRRDKTSYVADVLIGMYVLGPLATSIFNGDPVVVGRTLIPGVDAYDGGSALLLAAIALFPFLVGRLFLGTTSALADCLRALAWGGICYSVLLLFEMRMSPQLHYWVYGFTPSDFVQQIRGEGFRPMAFMGHGLIAGFFTMASFAAAAVLSRSGFKLGRIPTNGAVAYLGGILLLSRSLGATLYGVLLFPFVKWGSARVQSFLAVSLVSVALAFPLVRYANIVPTGAVLGMFEAISPDRAQSLAVRFLNENILLEKASERWLLGWGRYGRSRVYGEESGKDISVTDGRWIIDLGQHGLLGFIAEFGLLSLCVIRAANTSFRAAQERLLIVGASLLLAINVVELIPNSTLTPWSFLLAGMLLGRAEAKSAAADVQKNKDYAAGYHFSKVHGGG